MSHPRSQPSETALNYIPCLDGLRACAFLIVFLAHATPGKIGTYIPATFGVTVFFFLSGYLITTLLRRESEQTGSISLKAFYLRRSLRILPPMYVAYAITFVAALSGVLAERGNIAGLLASFFYYYNYSQLLATNVTVPTGMTVLWSLSIEEHFYLVFPLAYLLLIRSRITVARQSQILLSLCLAGLAWRLCLVLLIKPPILEHLSWTYAATDSRFDSLLWGCLLAVRSNPMFKDQAPWLRQHCGKLALAGLGTIFASMYLRQPVCREAIRYSLQGAGLYPVFYYCIRHSKRGTVSWLEWKPLRWIGWLSYSLYLIHNALLLKLHLEYPQHLFIDGIVAMAGSILYAWLVRCTVELPIQRARNKEVRSLSTAGNGSGIAA